MIKVFQKYKSFIEWVFQNDNAPPPGKLSKAISSYFSPPKSKSKWGNVLYFAKFLPFIVLYFGIWTNPFGHFSKPGNAAPSLEKSVCVKEVV